MRFYSMRSLVVAVVLSAGLQFAQSSEAKINSDLVLVIDGKKVFPIGFTTPPPPDGKTPRGKNGIKELADAGATFMRTGAWGGDWDDETIAREKKYLDAAARYGMYCMPYLRKHAKVSSDAEETQLRQLLNRFKDHPGLGAWKGDDEPEWGKVPLEPLTRAYRVIKEVDPKHPVVIIHAPRGTVESLRPYNSIADVLGADIYPVGVPPGAHSLLPNKNISLVGDHTRIMIDVAEGKMPVWMVLQIAWSGVVKPGKTLVFPTFQQERFMTYEAIINGARGLIYFGGSIKQAMTPEDAKLGWNWTFWDRVLRRVVEEIGTKSPLYPALVAPNSKLPIQASGAPGLEFCVREVEDQIFILACKREGETAKVEFSGLPGTLRRGDVLFESSRRVEVKQGRFSDAFEPFSVHVYRFRKAR